MDNESFNHRKILAFLPYYYTCYEDAFDLIREDGRVPVTVYAYAVTDNEGIMIGKWEKGLR